MNHDLSEPIGSLWNRILIGPIRKRMHPEQEAIKFATISRPGNCIQNHVHTNMIEK